MQATFPSFLTVTTQNRSVPFSRRRRLWLAAIVIPLLNLCPCSTCQSEPQPADSPAQTIEWFSGPRFRHELEQPFSGSWSGVEFRDLLKDVARDRHTAIVLDRRLDPSAETPIQIVNSSLQTGLTHIARQIDTDVSFPDGVVYFGPRSATRHLRTLIELREQELQSKPLAVPKSRRTELLKPMSFFSTDLETPHEILDRFTRQTNLSVIGLDLLPYDLWAAMDLPNMNVIEAMSLVLIQFDLTFTWKDKGNAIELVPVPEAVAIEKKHRPRQKVADAQALLQQRFPRLDINVLKSEIVVKATVEEHETIASLLKGEGAPSPIRIESPKPLNEQLFTLEAAGVPITSLMSKLEESAISFEYDAEEFRAAEIDLQHRIQINVKKVTAAEFFKRIFDPVGVDVEINHLTVKLKPRPKN